MRKFAGLLFAAILLVSLPTLVPAAGLFGAGTSGFPSFFGGSYGSSCDPGGFCCPSVYVGYEIQQNRGRKPLNFGANGRTGVADGRTAFISNQLNTDASDPGGLWLGISEYCQLTPHLGIMASGWYLFPGKGNARETYGVAAPEFDDTDGFTFGASRTWQTTTSWGWVDAMAVLGCSPCGMNLIAGFRWDSFSVRLSNPNPGTITVDDTGFDLITREADLTVNSYIPLIGTQYCCGGPCCGLLVRVVGFPWVPSNVRYGETINPALRLQFNSNFKRASFIEVFSEYSRNCGGFGCIGIFARFNHFEGKGTATPHLTNLPVTLAGYDFTANRTSWAVGGKLSLDFALPGLPNFGLYF